MALVVAGSASAGIVTPHVATDAEMLAYIQNIAFVAEGRIGDRGGAATFELDLGDDTGNPATTAQYDWQTGVAEPFTVSGNATNFVTFVLGGKTVTYSPGVDFREFFVRTRAVEVNTSIQVYDLVLNGETLGDGSSATGPDGLDILAVSSVDLYQGFTLTGVAVLLWSGTPPTQSRLAFQVKVGNAPTVPVEETSWGKVKGLYR